MPLETRIYQKENNISFLKLLKASLKDVYGSRFLAKQLTIRDIKARYRQSYFGFLWAFIMPLTTAFIWVFLNGTGTVKLSDTGIPYPVYAFSGTLIWSIITGAINAPLSSTKSAKGIMSKINFPKEALILSGIYKLLFDSSIKIVVLLAFVIIYGVGFHWSLLWFPVALLGVILFGVTIGLFITPLGMLYNDISKLITMGLGFVMYVTPVVYAIPKTGLMKTIMSYNPLTALILTSRDVVVGTTTGFFNYFIIIGLLCIPLLFFGLVFYRISIPVIVERA
ncbi:ABC transporter permease [Aestuariibaculum sediminum]|uniref:ABC transporter permease n=1 Tax=Aestuariibaculum sediminum TaxID=2770637 RepID=A0A8J6U8E6_9FLAO|nr:ABC transporter permease [Aestuariibaculum sediminum]MBD0833083.1 ABC transporter permease [Aestuariibaculum sediminum]